MIWGAAAEGNEILVMGPADAVAGDDCYEIRETISFRNDTGFSVQGMERLLTGAIVRLAL